MTKEHIDSLPIDDEAILSAGIDAEMCAVISQNKTYHRNLRNRTSDSKRTEEDMGWYR